MQYQMNALRFLSSVQPLVGLVVVIMGGRLARRKVDPGIKILMAWGAFWVLQWSWLRYNLAIVQPTLPVLPEWVQTVSFAFDLVGQLMILFTALYALWRFWRASVQKRL